MIEPGDILYGYCGGYFGRDSYGEKRVVAVGRDWIVVREGDGRPNFAECHGGDIHQLLAEATEPPEER